MTRDPCRHRTASPIASYNQTRLSGHQVTTSAFEGNIAGRKTIVVRQLWLWKVDDSAHYPLFYGPILIPAGTLITASSERHHLGDTQTFLQYLFRDEDHLREGKLEDFIVHVLFQCIQYFDDVSTKAGFDEHCLVVYAGSIAKLVSPPTVQAATD